MKIRGLLLLAAFATVVVFAGCELFPLFPIPVICPDENGVIEFNGCNCYFSLNVKNNKLTVRNNSDEKSSIKVNVEKIGEYAGDDYPLITDWTVSGTNGTETETRDCWTEPGDRIQITVVFYEERGEDGRTCMDEDFVIGEIPDPTEEPTPEPSEESSPEPSPEPSVEPTPEPPVICPDENGIIEFEGCNCDFFLDVINNELTVRNRSDERSRVKVNIDKIGEHAGDDYPLITDWTVSGTNGTETETRDCWTEPGNRIRATAIFYEGWGEDGRVCMDEDFIIGEIPDPTEEP